jgi:hypothetical protein
LSIFAVILTHFFSHILKKRSFLFNDLALGIIIVSLVGLKITWWGPNTNTFILILVILFGIITNIKNSNLKSVLLFFLLTASFNLIFTVNVFFSIKQLFVPGFIFFSFFILFQNTSVSSDSDKIKYFYIFLVSILAITLPKLGLFTDPLMTSLIIADILLFSFKTFLPININKLLE